MAVGSGGLYAAPTVSLRKEDFEKSGSYRHLYLQVECHRVVSTDFWARRQKNIYCDGKFVVETWERCSSLNPERYQGMHRRVFWIFEIERRLLSFQTPRLFSVLENCFCSVWSHQYDYVEELQKQILFHQLINNLTNHQKSQSSMWWRSGVEDSTLLPQFLCERRDLRNYAFSEAFGPWDEWAWRISELESRTEFIVIENPLLRTLPFAEYKEPTSGWGWERSKFLIWKETALLSNSPCLFLRTSSALFEVTTAKMRLARSKFWPTELPNSSRNQPKLQSSMWWRSEVEDSTLLPQFVCQRRILRNLVLTDEKEMKKCCDVGWFLELMTERVITTENLLLWKLSFLLSPMTPNRQMTSVLVFWMRKETTLLSNSPSLFLRTVYLPFLVFSDRTMWFRSNFWAPNSKTALQSIKNPKARCDGGREWRTLRCSHSLFAKGGLEKPHVIWSMGKYGWEDGIAFGFWTREDRASYTAFWNSLLRTLTRFINQTFWWDEEHSGLSNTKGDCFSFKSASPVLENCSYKSSRHSNATGGPKQFLIHRTQKQLYTS